MIDDPVSMPTAVGGQPDSGNLPPDSDLRSPGPRPSGKGKLREWVESLAFTIVFVLLFTQFVAQATQVPTESMKPAIMVGDHFFLDKLGFPSNYPEVVRPYLPARSIEHGDIIAFRAPDGGNIPFVKRVIGVPGDVIEIRDKIVWANGVALEEPYKIYVDEELYTRDPWIPEQIRIRDNYGPVDVPEGSYFAMGDNRDNSNDSRYWGFVPHEDVIGKPLFVYWSYQNDPYLPGDRTLGDRVRGYASVAAHFFTRTRWFRMGSMID